MFMKKNYFFLVSLMLFMAVQAKAQVTSISDLFGDYKFTADVEFTAEGEAYKDKFLAECDATISMGTTYMAKIIGFAGSQTEQNITDFSAEQEKVKITNPNNPQLFNGVYFANVNGDNPYGVFDNGEWVLESMPVWYYTYNPETKEISIPDFTIITLANAGMDLKGTILAKYTNVKMTLVKSAEIEVANIEGDWNFAAGKGTYSTMEGSVIPTEFAVNLAKTGDDNRNYNATVAIEGYEALTFPATFDGQMLELAYDNTYLDEANGIRVAPMYGSETSGIISFKVGSSNDVFTLYDGFAFASDVMGKASDEVTDSLFVNGMLHQWYMDGSMRRPTEAPEFTWDGTYKVTGEFEAYENVAIELLNNFEMTVEYHNDWQMYLVTEFMGCDLVSLNYGGLEFVPAADGKSAEIVLSSYGGPVYLYNNGDGTYLQLADENATAGTMTLTLKEDGTIDAGSFFICVYDDASGTSNPVVFYEGVTAEKVVEEVAPAFDLAGEYVLTASADVYYAGEGVDFPTEFNFTIEYFDLSDYGMDSYYGVTKFMGRDIAYSPIEVTVVEAGKSYELKAGDLCGAIEAGKLYYKLYDMNATDSSIEMTVNEDGTIGIANFFIKVLDYNAGTETAGAYYKNVTLTRGTTGIDNVEVDNAVVEGIFDIQGRRINEIQAPGLYIINGKKVLVK